MNKQLLMTVNDGKLKVGDKKKNGYHIKHKHKYNTSCNSAITVNYRHADICYTQSK